MGLLFALAAVGPGGASAIFLVLAFFFGLIGAVLHCLFISLKSSSGKAKVISSIAVVAVFGYIVWLRFTPPTCIYTETQAIEKVSEHVAWLKRNPDNMGEVKFNRSDCSYSFTYEGLEGKYEHIFSNWGEVHTWDYSQGDL